MFRQPFCVILLAFVSTVWAQTQSEATCDSSFSWSFNSKNESPCQIAESLAAVCNGGQFSIAAIAPNQVYSGPTRETASDCRCSSVFYSMLSACAGCQNRSWIRWSAFKTNCSTVYPGLYPHDLPTSVPAYGFQDVNNSDLFNISQALAESSSGAAESSSVPQSTGAASVTVLPTISTPQASETTEEGSKSKTNVGAIAGGTVGGVVFVAIVAGLVFWYLRKRREQPQEVWAPGPPMNKVDASPVSPYTFNSQSHYTEATLASSPYMGSQSLDPHMMGSSLERRPSSPEI